MRAWFIYGLTAPTDERVRYVGLTSEPGERLRQHVSKARHSGPWPLYDWIRSLLSRGAPPRMVILERGAGSGVEAAERKWIKCLRELGLFNVSPGGNIPVMSPEARKRMAEKLKTRIFTPEHRARIAAAKLGMKRPDNAARNREKGPKLRGRKLNITDQERERRSGAAKRQNPARSARMWATMTSEERARRSEMAREQMRRVWAERRAAAR